MDLFTPFVRGRAARHQQRMEIENYNENVDLIDAAREEEILTINDTLQQTLANEAEKRKLNEIKDSLVAGIGARTTIANLAKGLDEGKSVVEVVSKELGVADEAKRAGEIASHINSVGSVTKDSVNMAEHAVSGVSNVKNEAKLAETITDSTLGGRVAHTLSEGSAGLLGKAGGFMNVGLGMYDAAAMIADGGEDYNKENGWKEAAELTQMASGALELGGLVGGPELLPLAAIGAGLGVVSSVLESVGEEAAEDVETEAAKQASATEVAGLAPTPEKIRESVPERIVGSISAKVSG